MLFNFKIYDVTTWLTNNCNTYIAQYSRSKSNQAMKFGQLIEYIKRNSFLQKSCRKWGREISSRSFLVFNKALNEVQVACSLLLIHFDKLYKTLNYWSRDMLNFDFLDKGLGKSFYTAFCVWFFKKNVSHVLF